MTTFAKGAIIAALICVGRLYKLEAIDVGPFYANAGSSVTFNCSFECVANYIPSWCAIWNYANGTVELSCSDIAPAWNNFSNKYNATTYTTYMCFLALRFVATSDLNNAMFVCRRQMQMVSGATSSYEYSLPRLLQIKSEFPDAGSPSFSVGQSSSSVVFTSQSSQMIHSTKPGSLPSTSSAPPISSMVITSSMANSPLITSTSAYQSVSPSPTVIASVYIISADSQSKVLGVSAGLGIVGLIIVIESLVLMVAILFICRRAQQKHKNNEQEVIPNHYAENPVAQEMMQFSSVTA